MRSTPTRVTTNTSAIIFAAALFLFTAPATRAQHDHQHQAHAPAAADSASAAELAKQIAMVRKATERYADIEAAKRDGYVMFGREERPLMGEHWYRTDLVQQPLDLTKPSTLQYASIDGKRTLIGVAYTVYQRPSDAVPEGFAGSTDHWHVHDVAKMSATIADGRPLVSAVLRNRMRRNNPAVRDGRTHLAMVHAWTGLENPDGMFAEQHRVIPYLQAGLPASYAAGATENAAWGIALIQRDGCDKELRAIDGLAQLTRQQHTRLETACALAEGKVLREFNKRPSASQLNAVADQAWSGYLKERAMTLTPAQKARLASVVEHPGM